MISKIPFTLAFAIFALILLGLLSAVHAQDSCQAGQSCTYTNTGGNCSQGVDCTFVCYNSRCIEKTFYCGTGLCTITCYLSNVCSLANVYAGSGSLQLTCSANDACDNAQVFGSTGPLDIDCGDLACQSLIVKGGSGPIDIDCDGTLACYSTKFNLDSGPTSIYCNQAGACFDATVTGGTGVVNLTCAGTLTGSSASCYEFTMTQNNAILSESSIDGTYYNFACGDGQWQCNTDLSNPICVSDLCECNCQHGTCGNTGSQFCASCIGGWTGGYCDTCDYTTNFGPDCQPCTCVHAPTCGTGSGGTGICTSPCDSDWTGDNCDTCDPTTHYISGSDCLSCTCQHGTCNSANGECSSCTTGWTGENCDTCDFTTHYISGSDCLPCTCVNGECNAGATGSGTCLSCIGDWTGDNCDTCDYTTNFGPHCQLCTCVNGECNAGATGSGTCSSCIGGWSGENCDSCDYTTHFGPDCQPCTCVNGECNAGATGSGTCLSCVGDWSGENCDTLISTCPYQHNYDHVDWPETPLGSFASGTCIDGYKKGSSLNSPKRHCGLNGVWDHRISYGCTRNYCDETIDSATQTHWPAAPAKSKRLGSCVNPGSKHPPQRYCNPDGTWGNILENSCKVI